MEHMQHSISKIAVIVQDLMTKKDLSTASDVLNIIAYWGETYAEKVYKRNKSLILSYRYLAYIPKPEVKVQPRRPDDDIYGLDSQSGEEWMEPAHEHLAVERATAPLTFGELEIYEGFIQLLSGHWAATDGETIYVSIEQFPQEREPRFKTTPCRQAMTYEMVEYQTAGTI